MNILRPIQKDFYGDDYRWFFGTVINAHPPAGLEGRIKVRINGVHSPSTGDIPERDLPWAQVLVPTTEGGSSGIGRIPQIVAGSFVFGVFLDGMSSQIPLIIGSLPRVELPTSNQTKRTGSGENSYDYKTIRYQNAVSEKFKDDGVYDASLELRRLQSMKFFIDNGYPLIQAASITGALIGASSLITFYDETPTRAVVGVANWKKETTIGSRYNGLLRFASNYTPASDWRLFSIQLQYVLFELRNRFNLTNSKLLSATSIKDASIIMNREYLITGRNTEDLAQVAYDEVLYYE
jgi:hypothetical protein